MFSVTRGVFPASRYKVFKQSFISLDHWSYVETSEGHY